MSLAAHIQRRCPIYQWIRRLPALERIGPDRRKTISFSLGTSDPSRARKIGSAVTAASEELFERVSEQFYDAWDEIRNDMLPGAISR